jgi:hypothetical protein
MPELVKIGKTTRLPKDRAKELSSATGVATPFIVSFEQFFEDCDLAETMIHSRLEQEGVRAASNREFFICSAAYATRLIMELPGARLVAPVPIHYDPEFDRSLLSLEEEQAIRNLWVEADEGGNGTGEAVARDQIREAKKDRALEILKKCAELFTLVEDWRADFPQEDLEDKAELTATAPALLSQMEEQLDALNRMQLILEKCEELFDFAPGSKAKLSYTFDAGLRNALELSEKASAWLNAYEYDLDSGLNV